MTTKNCARPKGKTQTTLTLSKEDKAAFQRLAKSENRSLSNCICHYMKKAVRTRKEERA